MQRICTGTLLQLKRTLQTLSPRKGNATARANPTPTVITLADTISPQGECNFIAGAISMVFFRLQTLSPRKGNATFQKKRKNIKGELVLQTLSPRKGNATKLVALENFSWTTGLADTISPQGECNSFTNRIKANSTAEPCRHYLPARGMQPAETPNCTSSLLLLQTLSPRKGNAT